MSIWGKNLPNRDKESTAQLLFGADNPPGKKHISGSQDAIGIVFPGANRLNYQGNYWPESIETNQDEELMDWLERHLFLIPIGPRDDDFEVLDEMHLKAELAKDLANSASIAWDCLVKKDLHGLGKAMTHSFEAQCALFPLMTNAKAEEVLKPYHSKILGYKISGAGGGGYWVVVSEVKMDSFIPIKIRRR
jgi:galactokinase/mevalonate kinase-like predicted kinase